jgi:hypothetical protein
MSSSRQAQVQSLLARVLLPAVPVPEHASHPAITLVHGAPMTGKTYDSRCLSTTVSLFVISPLVTELADLLFRFTVIT